MIRSGYTDKAENFAFYPRKQLLGFVLLHPAYEISRSSKHAAFESLTSITTS
jgi:hypothetical protein